MNNEYMPPGAEHFEGLIFATAAADSLALPYENMSARRIQRWLGESEVEQSLIFGKGMTSDDTELCCVIAETLLASVQQHQRESKTGVNDKFDLAHFQKQFNAHFRWRYLKWFLTCPIGIGRASLKSGIRHCLGLTKTGVFSAGNGSAMRLPIMGLFFAHDLQQLKSLVVANSEATHTDPLATEASLFVALWSRFVYLNQGYSEKFEAEVLSHFAETEFRGLILKCLESVEAKKTAEQFVSEVLQVENVTGFVNHSVVAAFHVWLESPKAIKSGVIRLLKMGGDTDTNAAIFAAIAGIHEGRSKIPTTWLENLLEWPRSQDYMSRIAVRCAEASQYLSSLTTDPDSHENAKGQSQPAAAPGPSPEKWSEPLWVTLALRSFLTWIFVFAKLFRRGLPPY